ncbi:hypothetical protein QA640_36420 [Bradyrhizobium sp. CB82]|uniref:hypothetical protein n=1 Tax=Bradyrhizobium sp. CB82 TaxID=3039159 RepID=UPI0024B202F9|nr:hypothetical protein [Bradyrhizobium sp. CB82]WFU45235.1 hypothetical protein QA640_36420 [Bradyrhizobium sp. CB82]
MPEALFSPQSEINEALLSSTLLGHGLPSEAEHHLWEASLFYHLDEVAEGHLRQAEALAPEHAAVLIGLFRFYFYKARLAEALEVAQRCIIKAAEVNNLSSDWRLVRAGDAAFGCYENTLPRFFLFSLKGYAYLQMRLGRTEEGRIAIQKLLELDPTDKIGAKVLLRVLEHMGQDDD